MRCTHSGVMMIIGCIIAGMEHKIGVCAHILDTHCLLNNLNFLINFLLSSYYSLHQSSMQNYQFTSNFCYNTLKNTTTHIKLFKKLTNYY